MAFSAATARVSAKRMVKRLAIRLGLEAVALAGAPMGNAAGRGVVFTLHHVRPARGLDYEPNGHLAITPEFLDTAIVTAKKAGLHPVALQDLPKLLANSGDRRRFVAFTLDDGYRDNAEFAAPVFGQHGVPYTIFVTPGFVDRSRTIWWETAEELTRKVSTLAFDFGDGRQTLACGTPGDKRAVFERLAAFVNAIPEDEAVARIDSTATAVGIDPVAIVEAEIMDEAALRHLALTDPLLTLGAHTITHPALARVDEGRLARELAESAARVGGYGAGRRPRTFAYPYGSESAAGAREAAAARDAGFTVAVTTRPGVLGSPAPNVMTRLPRISLNGDYQKARYVRALLTGLPFKVI